MDLCRVCLKEPNLEVDGVVGSCCVEGEAGRGEGEAGSVKMEGTQYAIELKKDIKNQGE